MARQLLLEGTFGKSRLLVIKISFAPLKSSSSEEGAQIARVVTCMFKSMELKLLSRGGLRISLGIQMLEQLVNCFLKALVGNPDC